MMHFSAVVGRLLPYTPKRTFGSDQPTFPETAGARAYGSSSPSWSFCLFPNIWTDRFIGEAQFGGTAGAIHETLSTSMLGHLIVMHGHS